MSTTSKARADFRADRARFEALGIIALDSVESYVPEGFATDFTLAMDAQPTLATTSNSGIPAMLTTMIDPTVYTVALAPNKGADILGETKKGTWLDETALFPTVEQTGEVSTYGDHANGGVAGLNNNFEPRQSYLFQVIKNYGEREMERAGLARIDWAAAIDRSAATTLAKFANYTYHFGVTGLQNYGLLNDPGVAVNGTLTPAIKASGGTKWLASGSVTAANANEIYVDIESLFGQLVAQTGGAIDTDAELVLVMSPGVSVALTATNTYAVNVRELLTKNFPNLKIVTDPLYGAVSAINPQGLSGGNMVQLIATSVEGQDTGYCAYNEKMRQHPVIRDLSSFRQKVTGGTWGAIIRQPYAVAQMLGV